MKISIIIPCFNNAESIEELYLRLIAISKNVAFNTCNFEIVMVDDGSKDHTYAEITKWFLNGDLPAKVVKLTRNFGSYNAFLCGVNYASGDCCVYLHADLQDPPELIPEMFAHYLKGFKLVIANRASREDWSLFSSIYHYLVKKLAIKNTPPGGFDLILFDQQIRDDLINISEKNTNNVYLINWLGYPYVNIPYKRSRRKHGKSQWRFTKKIRLFVDTFFSFSNLPVQIVRLNFLFSIVILCASIIPCFFPVFENFSTLYLLAAASYFGLSLNFVIISEYLVRIHETVRNRPNFVVEKVEEVINA